MSLRVQSKGSDVDGWVWSVEFDGSILFKTRRLAREDLDLALFELPGDDVPDGGRGHLPPHVLDALVDDQILGLLDADDAHDGNHLRLVDDVRERHRGLDVSEGGGDGRDGGNQGQAECAHGKNLPVFKKPV